ncbi:unnamed protein product [Sphagnum jensenii]|uniref:Enoyl reductase (ER) domain-containing protein n=1 Tax=Sphagnum jensenii TaxID=128206 RepID=A0ABP1BUH6_9BRYO
MTKTMRAVQYSGYGGGAAGLKHVEIPVPVVKKDYVLIRVEAVSINPHDWKIQDGYVRHVLPPRFPHTPGTDVAGEVVGLGLGVTTFSLGDKVVSCLGTSGGGLAEYALAHISTTAKRPLGVTAIEGACLGDAAFSALQSVRDWAGVPLNGRKLKVPPNILITDASGAVGTFAVQLAKLGGAHVTATCCEAKHLELVKSLGADEVLDSKTPGGESLESPSGKKYDTVIQCGEDLPFAHIKPQLSRTGKVINLTPSPKSMLSSAASLASFSKQKCIPFMPSANTTDYYFLFSLMQQKKLKIIVDSEFLLEQAEKAWAASIAGHATGKIVVKCTKCS